MNKKIVLFSFALFFAALCTCFYGHKGNMQSFSNAITKNKISQKYDHQNPDAGYTLSDNQDDSDPDDLEKVKLDYSIIAQQYINLFFSTYSYASKPIAVRNPIYITIPRYILYHSLQIDIC